MTTRKKLILELTSYANLLAQPAPSWEPRAHDRYRAGYQAAAMRLADLEVRAMCRRLGRVEHLARKAA